MNVQNTSQTKLALISSGLGTTYRGFEISTARWYEALKTHSNLDVRLFCGGNYAGGRRLWNIPRRSIWTKPIAHIPFVSEQHRWEIAYGIEQISFWSALNFELIDWKPDVIWVKDVPLAHLLMISRIMFGLNFRLIIANGGMLKPQTCKDFDLIQQISLNAYEQALAFGIPKSKMLLIGNCLPEDYSGATNDCGSVRQSLGIAPDDWLVVCVAAWNSYHKRIDYLLQEVAALTDNKVKLIICGTPEVDAASLQQLGKKLLGERVYWLTLAPNEVANVLREADVFVLPSLRECFGNVLLEAAMSGLPIVTHPHDGAKFAIQDEYWMADLSLPGNLTARLQQLRQNPPPAERLAQLRHRVISRFGPQELAAQFENAVETLANHHSYLHPVSPDSVSTHQ